MKDGPKSGICFKTTKKVCQTFYLLCANVTFSVLIGLRLSCNLFVFYLITIGNGTKMLLF
jgi:hypothetical protein